MNRIEKLTINGVTYDICDPEAKPQDEAVGEAPWSSRKILDTFAPKFSATGDMVSCQSIGPLTVTAEDSATKIYRTGKNLYDFQQDAQVIQNMMSSSGVATSTYYGHILKLPAGTYTLKAHPVNDVRSAFLYAKVNDANGQWVEDINLVATTTLTTRIVTLQAGDVVFVYNAVKGQNADAANTLFREKYYIQVERGSQATTYQDYAGGEFAPGESIPSLPGDNVIWADQGSVTVAGWEDPVAKIRQLEAALGG